MSASSRSSGRQRHAPSSFASGTASMSSRVASIDLRARVTDGEGCTIGPGRRSTRGSRRRRGENGRDTDGGYSRSARIRPMARGAFIGRVEPGFTLPVLERIAPPPPPSLVGARIDRHTAAGDVVVDLDARGGWVARAAIDAGRRAVSIESGPLTRLLAEL